jgi:hypothetical protein
MLQITNGGSLCCLLCGNVLDLEDELAVADSCVVGLITKLNFDMTSCICLFKVRYVRTFRSVSRVQWTGLLRLPCYGVLGCCLNYFPFIFVAEN